MRLLRIVLLLVLLAPGAQAFARPAASGNRVWGRVEVVGDGWVRVPAQDLQHIGRTSGQVAVSRHGRIVPSIVDGDDLVFLAHDTESYSSRRAAFELHAPAPGPALPPSVRVTAGPSDAATTVDRRVFAPNRFLGPLAGSRSQVYAGDLPVWFAGVMTPGGGAAFDLREIRGHPAGPQTLAVRVYGTHIGKVVLRARWGTTDLGVAEAPTAAGGATLSWVIPHMGDASTLTLDDESPPPPRAPKNDVTRTRGRIWIDTINLVGRVTVPLSAGTDIDVVYEGVDAQGIVVDDGPRFAVAFDEKGPQGVPVRVASAGRLQPLRAPGQVFLGPGTHTGTLRRVRPEAADPMALAGTAEHVIIATPPLVAGARRLAAHRSATGTPSAVVPVLDVYDTYGGGEYTTAAVLRFLHTLQKRSDAPLRYVLLAGDATFNRTDLAPLVTIPHANPAHEVQRRHVGGSRLRAADSQRPVRRARRPVHRPPPLS